MGRLDFTPLRRIDNDDNNIIVCNSIIDLRQRIALPTVYFALVNYRPTHMASGINIYSSFQISKIIILDIWKDE